MKNLNSDAVRFVRTLRVATATSLAAADLASSVRARSATTFLALAAKGRDDWRFPADGLTSADGLLRARLGSDDEGRALFVQALGAAGLTRYALMRVRLRLRSGLALEGEFDRDGSLRLAIAGFDGSEAEFAGFEIEFVDGLP